MQVNLGLMFERKAKISCNGGRSGLDVCACGRLGRQTSARTKTFARLKITFVDMTYPGQRPEPPSLSPHFLLVYTHSGGNNYRLPSLAELQFKVNI